MLDLQHLQNFLVVLEQRSISKAAVLIRIAQPALSRQLQGLERSLGGPLLFRSRRGITATPAGEVLAERARKILREVQATADAVSVASQQPAGRLVVGVTASIARLILPPLAMMARAQLPEVQLSLTEAHSDVLHQRLLAGSLDMAVVHLRERLPGLETSKLFAEPIVATGQARVFSPETPISMRDVLRFESLVTATSGRLRVLYEEAAARSGVTEARLSEIDSFPALLELLAAGAGVSLLPFSTIAADVDAGRLSWATLKPRPLIREIGLVRSEDRIQTPACEGVERLIGAIVAERAAAYRWEPSPDLVGLMPDSVEIYREQSHG